MTETVQWQESYEYGLVPAIFGPWSTKTVAFVSTMQMGRRSFLLLERYRDDKNYTN